MLLAVAAREGLALRQCNIRTAFHNGELKEEVFIRAPASAEHLAGGSGRVLRLRHALYGLRQAPRAWNQRLETELRSRGFVQSDADPALLILHGENDTLLSMFYVDDGPVAAHTDVEADAMVELVASIFEIRALGKPQDFLGIEISRDHAANTIVMTIAQKSKALALAAELGVSGSRRVLPMPAEVYAGLRAAHPGVPMADKQLYQRVLGSLLHLAQCTRPDIALPVSALAYAAAPTKEHHAALVDIISTAAQGITYGGKRKPLGFWCDANFAACQDTLRSTTGWVVTMYGEAVSWSSKKQATTAASTVEAEYQACGAAARAVTAQGTRGACFTVWRLSIGRTCLNWL
jgi:hypothetical protein